MRHRLALTIYCFTATAIFLGGFSIVELSRVSLFFMLILFFAIPILYATSGRMHNIIVLIFVIATPLVPIILVIDPVEIGMWGHDPYIHSTQALRLVASGELIDAMKVGSYPGTYLLTYSISAGFRLPLETVAKYIPLITATIPLFFYIATKRWVGSSNALVIAIITASTRTLLTFESKFVDEILAVTLGFLLLFLLQVSKTREQKFSAIGVMVVITLSHHAVSCIVALGLALWWVTGDVLRLSSQLPVVGLLFEQLAPHTKEKAPTLPTIVVMIILGTLLPLFFGEAFFGLVLMNLINSFVGETTSLSGGGVSAPLNGLFAATSSFLIISLILLTLYSLRRVFQEDSDNWEVGWLAFVGFLGVIYALSLLAGRVVPLDPIRLLIFIVPFLAALTISKLPSTTVKWRICSVILVATLLIVPNLAAIPAHLLISDTGYKPNTAEGHFTEQQWSASIWSSSYNPTRISALERDLWAATESNYVADEYGTCTDVFVARDGLQQPDVSGDIIYDNGNVDLWLCGILYN